MVLITSGCVPFQVNNAAAAKRERYKGFLSSVTLLEKMEDYERCATAAEPRRA